MCSGGVLQFSWNIETDILSEYIHDILVCLVKPHFLSCCSFCGNVGSNHNGMVDSPNFLPHCSIPFAYPRSLVLKVVILSYSFSISNMRQQVATKSDLKGAN